MPISPGTGHCEVLGESPGGFGFESLSARSAGIAIAQIKMAMVAKNKMNPSGPTPPFEP